MEDDNKIVEIIREMGVSAHYKGYSLLIDSIEIIMDDPAIRATNDLYPMLAEINRSTPSKVERNIRHAIHKGWENADYDLKALLFRQSIKKPTNSCFIWTIADTLARGMY